MVLHVASSAYVFEDSRRVKRCSGHGSRMYGLYNRWAVDVVRSWSYGYVFEHHDGAFDILMVVMDMEQGGVSEPLSIAMALRKGAQREHELC